MHTQLTAPPWEGLALHCLASADCASPSLQDEYAADFEIPHNQRNPMEHPVCATVLQVAHLAHLESFPVPMSSFRHHETMPWSLEGPHVVELLAGQTTYHRV